MYENFKTEVKTYLSDRYYFDNKYYIEKTVISTYLYYYVYANNPDNSLPPKKLVKYQFSFCILKTDNFIKENQHIIKNIRAGKDVSTNKAVLAIKYNEINTATTIADIITDDLTEELKIYCPDPNQDVYFAAEQFYKGKKLWQLYSVLPLLYDKNFSINSDPKTDLKYCSINRKNLKAFENCYKNIRDELLYHEKISPKIIFDLPDNCLYLAYIIYNYLVFYHFEPEELREFEAEELDCLKHNPSIYFFIKNIVDDYWKFVAENESFIKCANCNKIIKKTHPRMKYCPPINGYHYCKKSANNANYYKRIKKI